MNKHFLLLVLLFVYTSVFSQKAEYYFRFDETNKTVINSTLTRIISIDKIEGSKVFAYANEDELNKFKDLGYSIEILPAPSSINSKAITMATTVAQMSNWDKYPTYEVYCAMMRKFEQDYPSLCKLDSIGNTNNGRKLYIVKISDNANTHEAEPEFLFSSTMHGDETTGFVLMLRLINHLLSNYSSNSDIQNLVNTTQIFIVPDSNPDGTYYGGNSTVANSRRSNGLGIDLNRNFPDPRDGNHPDGNQWQIENIAMMNLAEAHNFVMGGNFHGGAEVANYPWDTWTTSSNSHADASWFSKISRDYATSLQNNSPAGYFTDENNGITEGGDWYVITGGRQDYMNYYQHCREITFEISSTKCPSSSDLPSFWNYNYQALINFIKLVHTGFNGTVTNSDGNALEATISIEGHDRDNSFVVSSSTHGDYYRPIAPGTYNVTYSATGYIPQNHTITVNDYTNAVEKNVVLVQKQTATLNGTITDAETGNPISNATLSLADFNPVTSNSNGQYSFSSLFEGEYNITVSCANYTTRVVPITIEAGANAQDFELTLSQAESFEGSIPEGITFTSGNWSITNSEAYDGNYSIRSASIGDNASTTMQLTIRFNEAGNISFAKKVSSEANYDYLKFYIDSQEKGRWSGNSEWEIVSFAVSEGLHTLKWTYEKDYGTANGSDCAWIDYIETPETKQNVIFITCLNGIAHEGYTVNFNGSNATTDAQGKAVFSDIERGNNLAYSVKLNDSTLANGTLNVYWVDVNKTINLEHSCNVTFAISTPDNSPVENATVTFNSIQQQTNASGTTLFANTTFSDNIAYSVEKDGYEPINSTINIHSDTTISIELQVITVCDITFSVTNNGSPLSKATISFNSQSKTTNNQGIAVFTDAPLSTNLAYSISRNGYITVNGSVIATSDSTISVSLIKNSANVTFNVTSEGSPLSNVSISLNNTVKTTSVNGTATFNNILKFTDFDFSANKDGYINFDGSLNISADTTISIDLTRNEISSNIAEKIVVWPNPFSSSVKINIIGGSNQSTYIDIYNILGKKIDCISNEAIQSDGFEWTPNNQPKGVYFMVITCGNKKITQKLIYR